MDQVAAKVVKAGTVALLSTGEVGSMDEYIEAPMTGKKLDSILKAILDSNQRIYNGKALYIHRGQIAFETFDKLADIKQLEIESGGG